MSYISVAEANSYLSLPWEDTLVTSLISYAEAKINSYLWVTTLSSTTYTEEKYNFKWNWPYYLSSINPTSLTEVDGVAFSWDYQLYGRELKFYLPLVCNDTMWNKITFTYVAWFSVIPDDIKKAMLDLVWLYYNSRKTNWLNSFTQGQITVNYWSKNVIEKQDEILTWLRSYKKNNIYATDC